SCQERRQQRVWTAGGGEAGSARCPAPRWRNQRDSEIADYVVEGRVAWRRAKSQRRSKTCGGAGQRTIGGAGRTTCSRRSDTSPGRCTDIARSDQTTTDRGCQGENGRASCRQIAESRDSCGRAGHAN